MSGRRTATAALGACLAPLVLGAATVQPAGAAGRVATASGPAPRPAAAGSLTAAAYDRYGLTALASGVRTSGTVGNAGGLVTLDSGSGYVAAHLDSSPSAGVLADPYEPGPLVRTVAGQANANAGSEVITVPDAAASYPGTGRATLVTVPTTTAGPLTLAGGSASALATANRAEGTATGSAATVTGAVETEGSVSSVRLRVDAGTGAVSSTGTTRVAKVVLAGVLELRDVVAEASITTHGDAHATAARLTVAGASVGGQEVAIDATGVHAVGTTLVPGTTLSQATAAVDSTLRAAGLAVHAAEPVRTAGSRSGAADTGGIVATLASPDLPGGVAANALTVVIGGVSLTEADTPALPAVTSPAAPPAAAARGTARPGVSTTTAGAGVPALPALAGGAPGLPPQLAALPPTPARFVLAGRSVSVAVALAAFAAWQLLSLGTATLYALAERRRRLGLS